MQRDTSLCTSNTYTSASKTAPRWLPKLTRRLQRQILVPQLLRGPRACSTDPYTTLARCGTPLARLLIPQMPGDRKQPGGQPEGSRMIVPLNALRQTPMKGVKPNAWWIWD